MPAQAPTLPEHQADALQRLGECLRQRRRALGLSATVAAEAAAMSRWSWARIEAGEPSVTMGAYLSAAAALGLSLGLHQPDPPPEAMAAMPDAIELDRYPQLKRLAWQQAGTKTLGADEALALYERNWRHIDQGALDAAERELIATLVSTVGKGRLLV